MVSCRERTPRLKLLEFAANFTCIKETTASEIFRRLNSYSQQHALYRALKAFGKIIKSTFILRYIDEVELRKAIAAGYRQRLVVSWQHINLLGEYDFR